MELISVLEENKVTSRKHVDEIWLAELRMRSLSRQWYEAVLEGDFQLAKIIEGKCERIEKEMLMKFDIIM